MHEFFQTLRRLSFRQHALLVVILTVFFFGVFSLTIIGWRLWQGKDTQVNAQLPVSSEESRVVQVVQDASPAVVSIVATAEVPVFETYYQVPAGLPEGLAPFFATLKQRQSGTTEQRVGAGTGFIVSTDGYIVTNKHVVADENVAYTVYVSSKDKEPEKVSAQVVYRDPQNDLAVLKVDRQDLPFLEFADSDNLAVGQTVITIGYALGQFENTVSKGVISGLARSIVAQSGANAQTAEQLQNLIQSDAAINPGNSGGPMLNLTGQVIGVNVAMVTAENIGFAIGSDEAKKVLEKVRIIQ